MKVSIHVGKKKAFEGFALIELKDEFKTFNIEFVIR